MNMERFDVICHVRCGAVTLRSLRPRADAGDQGRRDCPYPAQRPKIAADAAELLHSGKADVFGADSGVGYPAAEALPGAKIVPGAFALVRVAAARPKGRSAAAQAALATLVDGTKQTGVVQKAVDAKSLKGVDVATQ